MSNFYCANCGYKTNSVSSLTNLSCPRHPLGPNKGKHILYEGSEKSHYICKYCGRSFPSIANMTSAPCTKHPNGGNKGRHSPAL